MFLITNEINMIKNKDLKFQFGEEEGEETEDITEEEEGEGTEEESEF